MLRQPPTQIQLGRSDFLWHTENLDRRKTERASKKHAQTEAKNVPATRALVPGQMAVLPYHGPKPPSAAEPSIEEKSADNLLVSKEPVPHNSPAYWQSLVANVVGRPQPDHESNHATEPDDSDRASTHSDFIGSTYVDIDDYERSHSASIATDQGSEKQDNPELPNQLGDNIHPSSLKRLAFPFKYHRRSWKQSRGEGSLHDQHQQGLDGASDPIPTQPQDCVNTVEPNYQRATQYTGENARYVSQSSSSHSASDTGHVHASDSSISSHGTSDMGLNIHTTDHDGCSSSGFHQETTTKPISNDQNMEQLQRRLSGLGVVDLPRRASSGLPRSSLYISQSAISSSPEKSLVTPAKTHVEEGLGLPSLPPRRRIKYRPRADTYSYEESEISNGPKQYQHPSPANGINEINAPVQSTSLRSGFPKGYRSNSFRTQSPRQASDGYSTTSSIPTPSPVRNTQARYLISSGLPPPFSATPRTVSQNDVVPASSPRNPTSMPAYLPSAGISTNSSPTLPQSSRQYTAPPNPTYSGGDLPTRQRSPSPYAPETMHGNLFTLPSRLAQANSSSPMAPRTPPRVMPVYNDNLPAASQPQTPYQLPRRGVPIPDTYYTAPPRVSSYQASYQRLTPAVHTTAQVAERGPVVTEASPPTWPQAWRSAQIPVVNPVASAAGQGMTATQSRRPAPAQSVTGRRRNSPFWRSRRGEGFFEGQENTASVGSDVRDDVQDEEERDSGDGANGLQWLGGVGTRGWR